MKAKKLEDLKKMSKGPSLCWFCKNYLGGCSWARSFKPVEGWQAQERYAGDTNYNYGFRAWVGWCPEFDPDDGFEKLLLENIPAAEARIKIARWHGTYMPHVRYAVLRYKVKNKC